MTNSISNTIANHTAAIPQQPIVETAHNKKIADSLFFSSLLEENANLDALGQSQEPVLSNLSLSQTESVDTLLLLANSGPQNKDNALPTTALFANNISTTGSNFNATSTAITSTFNAIVTQVSTQISSLSPALATMPQSFVLSIPGHTNITVHTNITQSGTRKVQLDSEEQKFQSWIESNKTKLADALAKELNIDIDLSTTGGETAAGQKTQ